MGNVMPGSEVRYSDRPTRIRVRRDQGRHLVSVEQWPGCGVRLGYRYVGSLREAVREARRLERLSASWYACSWQAGAVDSVRVQMAHRLRAVTATPAQAAP